MKKPFWPGHSWIWHFKVNKAKERTESELSVVDLVWWRRQVLWRQRNVCGIKKDKIFSIYQCLISLFLVRKRLFILWFKLTTLTWSISQSQWLFQYLTKTTTLSLLNQVFRPVSNSHTQRREKPAVTKALCFSLFVQMGILWCTVVLSPLHCWPIMAWCGFFVLEDTEPSTLQHMRDETWSLGRRSPELCAESVANDNEPGHQCENVLQEIQYN